MSAERRGKSAERRGEGAARRVRSLLGVLAASLLLAVSPSARAAEKSAELDPTVDRSDPNFVTASLLVFGPGDELFSCVGHACIRLECPHYRLDYCFSYESERAVERLPKFLAGKLKMGLFAIPTDEFMKEYVDSGRGLRQYKLNLPPAVKQRLWKIMDDKAAEGANLPYDYNKRGCAKSAYLCIMKALSVAKVEREAWNKSDAPTRREKFCQRLKDTHPWNLFFLNAIVGTETDNVEEVVVPEDLLDCFRQLRVNGVPLIAGEGVELLPQISESRPSWFTPMCAAVLLVALALLGFAVRKEFLAWGMLPLQALAGCFFIYLTSASELPTSNWNWLIVPFNPLPLVFWRWRRRWAWAYAAVLVLWEAFMIFSPHQLTDPAYLVITLAYIVFFVRVGRTERNMV